MAASSDHLAILEEILVDYNKKPDGFIATTKILDHYVEK